MQMKFLNENKREREKYENDMRDFMMMKLRVESIVTYAQLLIQASFLDATNSHIGHEL